MNIAFYAPLKPPDSPIPSGDREIARMMIAALRRGGHTVDLVSRLRSFDRSGDAARQARLATLGSAMADRLLRRMQRGGVARPDLWFTYHLYHKAPDWLGPAISSALGIPYCVAEASLTSPHAAERWASGHRAVAAALALARLVISLNPKDEAGIRTAVGPQTRTLALLPFIEGECLRAAAADRLRWRRQLAQELRLPGDANWLLAVGMMRHGDKAASYRLLAESLVLLADRDDWQLVIAGDGLARDEVERAFLPIASRTRFVGRQPAGRVAALMAAADIMVWPAINEAIGMVLVEAAAAGLPAVAANRPGIAQVVADGETGVLVAEGDAAAFANGVASLLGEPKRRRVMRDAAASRAAVLHDASRASAILCRELEALVG